MIDHVGVNVSNYETSKRFFEEALAPLGYRVVMDFPQFEAAGFGTEEKPEFWVAARDPRGTGAHVAFQVADRTAVDEFHRAALAAGGTDNGSAGIREHYHPDVLRRVRPRPRRQQHRGRLPRGAVSTPT